MNRQIHENLKDWKLRGKEDQKKEDCESSNGRKRESRE